MCLSSSIDKNGTADEALKQIDDKGYLVPYTADGRRLVKAGVVFDTEKRAVGEWKIENTDYADYTDVVKNKTTNNTNNTNE